MQTFFIDRCKISIKRSLLQHCDEKNLRQLYEMNFNLDFLDNTNSTNNNNRKNYNDAE